MLDYQNVASDLLPTVAAAYALKFMGQVRCSLQTSMQASSWCPFMCGGEADIVCSLSRWRQAYAQGSACAAHAAVTCFNTGGDGGLPQV